MKTKYKKPGPDFSGKMAKFKAVLLIPFLIIGFASAIYLIDPLILQTLRYSVFDQYQRWHPRIYQASPVRIIDIDEDSLQKHGQWPWPRILVAELLDELRQSQPKVIAFDVIFAEPDRTSPKAMLKLWHTGDAISSRISQLPDHDSIFTESLQHGGVVLGFVAEGDGQTLQIPLQKARYIIKGPSPDLHHFSGSLNTLPMFEGAAAGMGALNFIPLADGVIRQVPLVMQIGDILLPSLSAETLRIFQNTQNYILHSSKQANGLQQIQIGKLLIPTTNKGEFWLHYSLPVPERYIPAWKVLSGEIPANLLTGQILLVGSSAKGLGDLQYNPLGETMPGIEAHAQAIEQMLSGEFLSRPDWANAVELPIIILGGLLVGAVALLRPISVSAPITILFLLALPYGGWLAFSRFGILLDPLTPGLAILLTFVSAGTISHFGSENRQRWLKQAFSRYVSPNRVHHILQNPEDLELGGQRRHCSFIFTDLSGYTDLMESIDPIDAVLWLNDYLDGMIAIAFKYNGTLDRIVGDAVAILFSAPLVQDDHQQRALLCALEMQAFAHRYRQQFNSKGINLGHTRIGVHSGEVIVGNFGGSTMFDYRALGDPVNTAARLESANKYLGTTICVSEATLLGCANIQARPIGRLLLKGKQQALLVYQPLPPGTAKDEEYQAAYTLMANHSKDAIQTFAQLAENRPADPLVKLHLKRLLANDCGDLIVLGGK